MHVKNTKTSQPKAHGLRGQPCMPARKYRVAEKTPMKSSKK